MTRSMLLFVLCAAVAGCSTGPSLRPYHSGASLPVETSVVHSDLRYFAPFSDRPTLEAYGVFAAADNEVEPYVLLAPRRDANVRRTDNPFAYYDIEHAATIPDGEVPDLLAFLAACAGAWDEERTLAEATYLSYRLVPEQDIVPVSGSVAAVRPSLEILFQMDTDGTEARMWLGEGNAGRTIRILAPGAFATMREAIERARTHAHEVAAGAGSEETM